ncbi:hypothetical protein SpAn4DRAFT_5061 [Sporomusa ovata]|uniref:Uncharacterized protein n=1 Tax=Sporomusa ovata TaxID=2378 RepID=A0A0U1KXM6_9FIRM|nr:hypothetical protein [Sporomusa ovata]CQR72172.1 hypothetical protein SpAn4DRAFT_5061 [Sporomusa ovata]
MDLIDNSHAEQGEAILFFVLNYLAWQEFGDIWRNPCDCIKFQTYVDN